MRDASPAWQLVAWRGRRTRLRAILHLPPPDMDTWLRLRAGTWGCPGRSFRGPLPSPHPRVGWGRAGRCWELLGDAQATQTADRQNWLGSKIRWKLSVGCSTSKCVVIMHHTRPYGAPWVPDG